MIDPSRTIEESRLRGQVDRLEDALTIAAGHLPDDVFIHIIENAEATVVSSLMKARGHSILTEPPMPDFSMWWVGFGKDGQRFYATDDGGDSAVDINYDALGILIRRAALKALKGDRCELNG